MSATMLQLVAQAIFDSVFPRSEGRPIPAGLLPAYLAMAHAAIEAMREPTDDMWDQAENASILAGGAYDAGDAAALDDAYSFPTARIWHAVVMWRAMIDEALR